MNYSAEDVLAPSVARLFCLWHLKRNPRAKFGEKLLGYFWSIARTISEQGFHRSVYRLQHESIAAAGYLVATDSCI